VWYRPCMLSRLLAAALLVAPLAAQNPASLTPGERARMEAQNAALAEMMRTAPRLPLAPAPITVKPPAVDGWAMGMVSWVAADRDGLIYLLQRGDQADPVIVIDADGRIVRSWGKGLYATPHAIRIDPEGHVWTADAASSMVYKFSREGERLLTIEVGGQPDPCGAFCSTTDVAFAPNGHIYIADGYRNARILEYTPGGQKVREWGSAGTGPGEFRLPHSIQIDAQGIVYVADRENGRIQRFTPDGTYLGEWSQYGKTFGMTLAGGALWLSTIPRGPNNQPGWLMQIDPATGALIGAVDSLGNHGMDVMPDGSLIHAPGPDLVPQRYRAGSHGPSERY
jgi:streptogramin lyase